jgi:hypothetical protein
MTDWLSWHSIFYINLPIGAVAVYVIGKYMHDDKPHHAHKIDYLGSVLLTAR